VGRFSLDSLDGWLMITHLYDGENSDGETVLIEGDAYRHLFRSRRLARGEELRLVDGRGRARWGEVVQIDRRSASVCLGEEAPNGESDYHLTLFVAALRPERASWLVEKATELGVRAVRFFASERAPRRYGEGQLDRLRRVAAAAVVQCHRAWLPEISGIEPWSTVTDLLGAEEVGSMDRIMLHPGGEEGTSWRSHEAKAGIVLVGPEGGWSDVESEQLTALGCRVVGLGPRVLRVETAVVVAVARMLL
jgi:16S rRNA (uracil1498-N3)-methyltransferase